MYTPRSGAPGAAPTNPDAQLRVMRILWVVFLITIGLFVLVTYVSRPPAETVAEMRQENQAVLLVCAALGLSSVAASFVAKASFYRRAAEQRRPEVLQTGFILAMALCESAVLFGLVGVFITRNDYAYGLFALGALGELLHFPGRDQVLSAYPSSVM
jgi:F0F1-type ATP synthase membrane subunit c/vacuolar-type H+-ATPase subunit K